MRTIHQSAIGMLLLAAGAVHAVHAAPNDFPTVARVQYVQDCMTAHPGGKFEMTSKCSCALDALAAEVSYDDYVTLSTIFNARTIGGERGGTLRENQSLEPEVKRYRDLQAKVSKGCFLSP